MIYALPFIWLVVPAIGYVAYKCTTYTLPCFIGMAAFQFALSTDAGWLGSIVVGVIAGIAAFYGLRRLYENLPTPARWLLGSVYAGCSTIVTYLLLDSISAGHIPSHIWRQTLCCFGASGAGILSLVNLKGAPFD